MGIAKYKVFLIILLSFIVGIVVASFIKIDFFVFFCVVLAAILFLFIVWSNKKRRLIGFIIIFISLGILRYNLSWPQVGPGRIQFYNNQKVKIEGVVINVEKKTNKEEVILESEKIQLETGFSQGEDKLFLPGIQDYDIKKVKGKVLIYASLFSNYQYGDQLEVSCQLYQPEPIAGFLYHEYLAKQDIYSTCFPKEIKILARGKGNFFGRFIFQTRDKIKTTIEKTMTEPESSILSTLLLGIGKETPQEVRNWFSATGMAHILSISGLHVAILASLLIYLAINFLGLARPKAFYFVVAVLIFYILLAGSPAAAVRSAIMGILAIFAQKIGRKTQGINLIIFTAAIMLVFNPKLLKSDMGFQLSFCAILGITLLNDYFLKVFDFLKFLPEKLRLIQDYLATTCSAYIFSLPLILFYFGNLSLIAPVANILILPILPFLMGLGFIFALISLIYFGLAQILAWPIWIILRYIVLVVKFLASVPFFSFNLGKINWWLMILMYFLLMFVVIKIKRSNCHVN